MIVTSTAAKDNGATISGTPGSYGLGALNFVDSDPQAVLPAGVTASGSFALMPAPTVTLSIGKTTKRIRLARDYSTSHQPWSWALKWREAWPAPPKLVQPESETPGGVRPAMAREVVQAAIS